MQTGEDIHDSLVTRIRRVRRQLDGEEQRIDALQQQLAETGERRCATLRALAEFHLPGMTDEAIAGTLSEMEADIRAIFDEKKDRLREVERLIPEQRQTVAEAEAALMTVTRALNETGEQRARLAHIVFEELQAMPRWQSLFTQVQRLEARVAASEKRHEAAEREQADKLPAYERDPLFAYLARRRFGTGRAAGTAVTRGLDRWVAGVIEYADSRAKYDFLKALPGHAAAVLAEDRAALAVAVPPLARLESEVVDRNGLTPVLERGERLYGEREDARRALREAETTLRDLTSEFSALHDERGSYYESAIDGLEAYLEGRTPDELAAMARASGDPRDDLLVAELHEIDERIAELRADLASRKDERDEIADRLAGLEDLRDQFEADDWNGRRSRFDDRLDVNALLLGYLAGSHSHGHVHRALVSSQHFLPIGDSFDGGGFGSGSFGGGFGGGGFSSGGGFGGGGGGFSTGGGF